ncbi:hypothetical protein ACIQOW_08530 [Kitasatospora sp. NPDC091335]|uniref:hypothetical protein n=1 Tax=Kitasatospora sp. NPDC091335 TaxID=3364085 RepID=UPI00380A9E1A
MTSSLLLALCIIAALCWLAAWTEQLVYERRQSQTERSHRRPRPGPASAAPRPAPAHLP